MLNAFCSLDRAGLEIDKVLNLVIRSDILAFICYM